MQRFFKVAVHARTLVEALVSLSGPCLVCHCTPNQDCHADVIISDNRQMHPNSFDTDESSSALLSSGVLSYLAILREEPPSDEGSKAHHLKAQTGVVESISRLKENIVAELENRGPDLGREPGDPSDLPFDFDFLALLLRRLKIQT